MHENSCSYILYILMPLHKKVKRSSGLYYGCSSFFLTGARSSRTAAQGSRNSIAVDLFISFMI